MTKDELKDELKNRISMAIKDPTLQQGFEIICRELADLQKEVIDLRRDKEDLIFVRNAKADHINELKAQIEKMKCCGNCKHCKYSESEESYEWCEKHDQVVNIAIRPCYAYEMFDLDKAIKEIEK